MLVNQTIDKLEALGLSAMASVLCEKLEAPGHYDGLSFADRLGLLVEKEADARDSRRLATRLKAAKLRYPAAVEDLDLRAPRGLDRSVVLSLAEARWVAQHHNVLVTGATGCGKSFFACALANAALRQGHSALYLARRGCWTTSLSADQTAATPVCSLPSPGWRLSSSTISS